jgi:hypothetical protein
MGLDGSHNAPQQQQQQQPGHNQQQPCLLPPSPLDPPTDAVPPAYGFTSQYPVSSPAAAAAAAAATMAAHVAAARALAGTEGGVRCVRDETALAWLAGSNVAWLVCGLVGKWLGSIHRSVRLSLQPRLSTSKSNHLGTPPHGPPTAAAASPRPDSAHTAPRHPPHPPPPPPPQTAARAATA